MVRRLVAGGAGLLVVILLVLLVKGCRDSAREQAFRDYFRNVNGLVQESNDESAQLFDLLTKPGTRSPIDLGENVNAFRAGAAQLVDRANSLDHPDELSRAQDVLLTTLSLRRDGIAGIAQQLPTALSDTGQEEATAHIAIFMRNFLASDVLYTERVVPNMHAAAKQQQLGDLEVSKSHFITDLGWLSPTTVADRIGRIRGGGSAAPATPGLHGTGLGTITVKPGGQTLNAGGATPLQSSPNLSFDVQLMNQGDNDETQVPVKLTVSGSGKPIVVQGKIDAIAAGETKTVSIPLAAAPPTGRPLTIEVQAIGVPGEKNLDNNKAQYAVVFTS
jgi:hypothetical protein